MDFFKRSSADRVAPEDYAAIEGGESARAKLLSDARHAPGEEAKRFNRAKPKDRPTTETEESVMRALRADPVPLGYISNALLYARPFRYLSVRDKQAIYSLFKGGALDVVRTYNPDNYWLVETSRVANPEYRSGRMLVDYDSYDVRGVLAGAYRGRDTMARPTLTHVVFKKDGHDLRCGCSQPIDNIVDPYGAQVAGTPPTCPRCLKIWEKLPRELEVSEGYLGREPNGLSDRPLAEKGLRSYRARGRYGWIMIGARDDAEALSEARRSTDDPRGLEVWDGSRYVPVSSRPAERAKNGAGYYVWVVDSSSRPLAKEGPYGPYHTLEGAKPYARISATEGAHDRIISRGRDPRSDDFEVVRKYQARTGKRII